MRQTKYIFDLDGTLYPFKDTTDFGSSSFATAIKQNILKFLTTETNSTTKQAEELYRHWKQLYQGHMSLAVERELGITREAFFQATWNIDPTLYINPSCEPRHVLEQRTGNFVILTGAPRIWAEAALRFLNVYDLAADVLITGEPDIRKPSAEAFAQAGRLLGVPFDQISSVSDEEVDIISSRSLGMRTIRVGQGETVADKSIADISALL